MMLEEIKGKEYIDQLSESAKKNVVKALRPFYKFKMDEFDQGDLLRVDYGLNLKVWAFPILYTAIFIHFLIRCIGVGFLRSTYLDLIYEAKEGLDLFKNPFFESQFYRKKAE